MSTMLPWGDYQEGEGESNLEWVAFSGGGWAFPVGLILG